MGASAAAFAVDERLKLEAYPVTNPQLTQTFAPPRGHAEISFRLRKRGTVTVWVLDSAGRIVRLLANDQRASGGTLHYVWNGQNGAGQVVPDGPYHIRVQVKDVRTIDVPNAMHVDTTPPKAVIVSVRPPALVRHRFRRVVVRYRMSEQGTPYLFVGRRRALVGNHTRRRGRFDWYATRDGRLLPPGVYRLTLRARDEAGNLSPPSAPVQVRVSP